MDLEYIEKNFRSINIVNFFYVLVGFCTNNFRPLSRGQSYLLDASHCILFWVFLTGGYRESHMKLRL